MKRQEKDPIRPEDLRTAAALLEMDLPPGYHCGSGYGADDAGGDFVWRIYVYTDHKDHSMIPKEWKGYPVSIRGVPKAYGL